METFPRNLNIFMSVSLGYLQINVGMPTKGIRKKIQYVNIPYLASWPTGEHHNNVKDPDKPVTTTKRSPIRKKICPIKNRKK
jgi:hypothetical protein